MARTRVAVIGSNSFSGSDFVDLLLDEGTFNVVGYSRSPEKGAAFLPYKRHGHEHFRFVQADMNKDLDILLADLDAFRPHYVVNFAAQSEVGPSWDHPEHWFQTNVVSLARFANALKDRDYLQRYVHISSPEAYGTCVGRVTEDAPLNPSTPYAASKAAADMFLKTLADHHNFPLVTIRATNVYGAHQQLFKIIPRTFITIRMGRKLQLHGGGVAVKSYIHIRDVSRGELAAMLHGQNGELYHFSPDGGVAIRDLVQMICEKSGVDFDAVTEDVAERLGQDAAYIIDSSKARSELGWAPIISLEEGLGGVADWIEANWDALSQEPHEYLHKA